MRLSLTAPPQEEEPVAWELLQSLGWRRRHARACELSHLRALPGEPHRDRQRGGASPPDGERPHLGGRHGMRRQRTRRGRGADIGVACGRGTGLLIAGGETLRKVPEERIVDELFEEIHERFE